ncbi:MAG: hypothetical protein SGCHY_001422 [Lobulomycetales sp.]
MDPQNQTTSSTAAAANNSTADASSNNSSSAHVNPNTSTTGNSNSNATETANSNSNGKFIETADSNGNGNTILNGNAYSSANGNPSTNSSGNGASASASIAAHSSASSSASATLDRSAARLALGRSTTASETLLSAASASTAVPPTTLSPAAATTAPEKLPKLLGADLEADRQSVCSIEDDPESASSSLFIPMSASRWMPSNNRVTTTKYTFLSFLPKNLAYQFSNIANIYFLGLILLQTVPELKIVDVSVTALPLILILTATAAKDAVEDYKRLRADAHVNALDTYYCHTAAAQAHSDSQHAARRPHSRMRALLARRKLLPKKNPFSRVPGLMSNYLRAMAGRRSRPAHILPEYIHESDYLDAEYLDTSDANDLDTSNAKYLDTNAPADALADSGDAVWKREKWQDVKVGQYLLLRSDDPIPADVLVVATSTAALGDNDCFVETKNLDGETNLKIKRGLPQFSHVLTPADCAEIDGVVETQPPTTNMYQFLGVARFSDGTSAPLDINNVLLRGCVLRNTDWVIGFVIATGQDTKLMLNSGATPNKKSRVDRQLNPQILLNFMILFIMCLVVGILSAIYQSAFNFETQNSSFNIPASDRTIDLKSAPLSEPAYIALLTFASAMIIFQNIIPIAIYISVDVCKMVQSYFIYLDADMTDPDTQQRSVARSWNLCDDLGQIEYIFSDKTGTLTCNVMELRKCAIPGAAGVYGGSFISQASMGAAMHDDTRPAFDTAAYVAARIEEETAMRSAMARLYDGAVPRAAPGTLSLVDAAMHSGIPSAAAAVRAATRWDAAADGGSAVVRFFTLLSVCHSVVVDEAAGALSYKAQSPDEAALVAAARDAGFAFIERVGDRIFVDIFGRRVQFTHLDSLEFSSDRKRMSVIVEMPAGDGDDADAAGDGDVLLLCKGADSVIFSRLATDSEDPVYQDTLSHLEGFASDGLRTLVLACRRIPRREYTAWKARYAAAQKALTDRDAKVEEVASEIEQGLELIGATAIEDRLQDGVPESIAKLGKAGIKIWVLTGDKMETAINIGFASNLLQRDMLSIIIKAAPSSEATLGQIQDALAMFWDAAGVPLRSESHALIIDGESLNFALDDQCRDFLLELACRCKSVICCRVSPLQKAKVVSLVRGGLSSMCLSIGDGANDVSMIQEADIGVGISGKEGLQAVMAADYSISQFRFLTRLLLVHGRWSYLRTSGVILAYFYKNIVWLFILFWYQFDSAFTGDIITDFTYGMFFNTIFSLLPNMVIGFFDQDVNDRISLQVPELYMKGIRQELYNMERFWFFVFDGIYQSVIIYYMGVFIFSDTTVDPRGFDSSREELGTFLSFYAIIIVNIYLMFVNQSLFWVTNASFWLTITAFVLYVFLFLVYFNDGTNYNIEMILPKIYTTPSFYLSLLLVLVIALIPRFLFKFAQQYISPTDTDIVQEYQSRMWNDGDIVDLDYYPVTQESGREDVISSSVSFEDLPPNRSNSSVNSTWKSLPRILRKSLSRLSSSSKKRNGSSLFAFMSHNGATTEVRNRGFAFDK